MVKNYFIIAIRHLLKNKLNSGINIFGLAVGIAASIMIFLFARHELTYDTFNKNARSIYLVYKERITPAGTQVTRDTWVPMAAELKNDYPQIQNAVRFWDTQQWVQVGEQRFQETVAYSDASLFEMFTLPLVKGAADLVFADFNSAVVSQEIARKYFGDTDPIGQTITVDYSNRYVVRGVLADIPHNSSLSINILAPFASLPWYEEQRNNWGGSFLSTFVQLAPPAAPATLEGQFPALLAKIWGEDEPARTNLKLLPLLDLYDELTGARTYAYILLCIAGVIVLIASINFMNLATARSLDRAREIGLRKVVGAARSQLIQQLLSESLVMSALALIVGVTLAEIFIPYLNSFYSLSLELRFLDSPITTLALVGLGLLVGICSGLYPAFFLSRFQPITTLKGKLKTSRAGLKLRNTLVITQFSLSIVLMIGTGVMWQQIKYMQDASLNFEESNLLAIPMEMSDFETEELGRRGMEVFRNSLLQRSDLASLAASTHVPGNWPGWFTFAYPDVDDDSRRLRMRHALVDDNYFETFGIEFVEGRNFDRNLATEAPESIIINEAARRDFGWPSALGRQVRIGDTRYNVIAVVKDYHFESLASELTPVLHRYRPTAHNAHNFLTVRLNSADPPATLKFIEGRLHQLDPGRTFAYFFVSENFDRLYENENRLFTLAGLFAILAIIIACLGLFALASFVVTQRTKEIGIRKVLGAEVPNIVFMLSKKFVILVGVAFLVACPLAYYLINQWLSDFAYRTQPGIDIFALSGILALAITFVTVSSHAIKAALANPVDSLRYE
ncbi:MAG TPA: ABC transporter permease [bacterium]